MTRNTTGLASLALAAQLGGAGEAVSLRMSEQGTNKQVRPVPIDSDIMPFPQQHVAAYEAQRLGHTLYGEHIVFNTPSEPPPPPPSPDEVISEVRDQDVLCGRGGVTNHHKGNAAYRDLVKQHQRLYLNIPRRSNKPKIARHIVDIIRRRNGRFLKKDSATDTWRDVGNVKAREKTSQALRERAPELRDTNTNVGPPHKKRKLNRVP